MWCERQHEESCVIYTRIRLRMERGGSVVLLAGACVCVEEEVLREEEEDR